MIENYIFDVVCDYVNNEINYIKQDMEISNSKDLLQVLNMLEDLSDDKMMEIAKTVVEDRELNEKINELIHYYLYHR